MAVPLLSTKFYIPPVRADAVSRPRLIERLFTGVSRPECFVLLSGPAGAGKTTLLSEFAAHLPRPVAWLSLDEGDNDPIRFWTYLIAACQTAIPGLGESALELLRTAQPLPGDTIPTILINDLTSQDGTAILVLDDCHVIQDPSIHAGLTFLLDHLPPNLNAVVSTRTDPPWPLARYRARNQLIEIRAQDLRFAPEEASEFLTRTMSLSLTAEDLAALEERTEGWAAGLQLAALSMQGRTDMDAFVRDFTGSHVYVAEYLLDEVLQRQPLDVQIFLLHTSILERLSAELCEAVTGCQDGQTILMSLQQANIFIVPLDDKGRWFRYHHLFRDLLQARLLRAETTDATAALHRRACDWYDHYGFVSDAIHHAVAARDFESAAALVDRAGQTMVFADEYSVLRNWLDVLPNESFQTHPRLEIYRTLIDLSLGKIDMSEQTLQETEKLVRALPPSPENDHLRAAALVYLSAFFAHQNTSRAIQMAQEALGEIAETDLKLRSSLFSTLYRAYGMEGDIKKSASAYGECLRLAQAAGEYGMVANTTMVRAFDLCQYGRLDEAVEYCQIIVDTGARLKRKFNPAGPCYIGLAGIHLERNELETAEDYLKRGMELCRQGGLDGLYTGSIQSSRLRQAKGDWEGAVEELCLLEQTLQRRDFTLTARQVAVWLAMGNIASASNLVEPILEILGESPYSHQLPLIAREALKLSLARIYIAQGETGRAKVVLDEIQATVEPGKRLGRLLEVHLLRALALQKEEEENISSEAIGSLERALELAGPTGFVLLFLEEGSALVPLLNAVVDHHAAPRPAKKYASKLLDSFPVNRTPVAPRTVGQVSGLVEPLTARESQVLELLAAGDSNQTIAKKLVITVRTVKKHTGNIFGKLNATSRTQAVARARELGLLPKD